jgi:hypothetical protein
MGCGFSSIYHPVGRVSFATGPFSSTVPGYKHPAIWLLRFWLLQIIQVGCYRCQVLDWGYLTLGDTCHTGLWCVHIHPWLRWLPTRSDSLGPGFMGIYIELPWMLFLLFQCNSDLDLALVGNIAVSQLRPKQLAEIERSGQVDLYAEYIPLVRQESCYCSALQTSGVRNWVGLLLNTLSLLEISTQYYAQCNSNMWRLSATVTSVLHLLKQVNILKPLMSFPLPVTSECIG